MIGHGIKAIAQIESENLRRALHCGFEAWTDSADASGLCDFYAFQQQAARDMLVVGESLLIWTMAADGMPQLKRLHPEQLGRCGFGSDEYQA